jgi:hypothetical protein
MQHGPSEAMVEWAKTAHLHMPMEFYNISVRPGCVTFSPLGTTSLQPTADFRRAIARLERANPQDRPLLQHVEHAEVSNLVIHGATSESNSHAMTQNADAILGTAPHAMTYDIPLHAKVMSSDQCTGKPAHTRLTVRRTRQGTMEPFPEAHAQQIMSFGNEFNQPPHQVIQTIFFKKTPNQREKFPIVCPTSRQERGAGLVPFSHNWNCLCEAYLQIRAGAGGNIDGCIGLFSHTFGSDLLAARTRRSVRVVNTVTVVYFRTLWNCFDIAQLKAMTSSNHSGRFPGVAKKLNMLEQTIRTASAQHTQRLPSWAVMAPPETPRITPEIFRPTPTDSVPGRRTRRRRASARRCGKYTVKAIIPGARTPEHLAAALACLVRQALWPCLDKSDKKSGENPEQVQVLKEG